MGIFVLNLLTVLYCMMLKIQIWLKYMTESEAGSSTGCSTLAEGLKGKDCDAATLFGARSDF